MECHYFKNKECLSCKNLAKGYESSVSSKVQTWSEKVLKAFPKVEILETISLEDPRGSRNKAKLVVSGSVNEPVIGIPKIGDPLSVQSLEDCPLHLDGINSLAKLIKSIIRDFKLTPYDTLKRTGELKLIIIYKSQSTKDSFIRFVFRSKESLDRLKKAVPIIQENFPEVKVITANIQPKPMAAMEGDEEIYLTDEIYVNNILNSKELPITTKGFFQVSSEIAEKLYHNAADIIAKENIEHLLDLFCGVGGFSTHAAKSCKKVTGVELSESAIMCANYSKELNRIDNIEFIAEDAFEYLKGKNFFDGVLVNPPRRGLGKDVVDLIRRLSPKVIIYSSCNPESFLKDITSMKEYELESIRPFDMFAFSDHLEVLGVLRRKNV